MPQRSSNKSSNSRSKSRNRSSDEPMMSHWADTARDKPIATAAAAAGAVAAGVFLWSKRNQISNQISDLSHQISDWAEGMQNKRREVALTGGPNESSAIESSRSTGRTRTGTTGRSTGSRTSASRSTGTGSRQTSGSRSATENETF